MKINVFMRVGSLTNPYFIESMLLTIAAVLLVLWFLGLITSYTLGGFIHILLVVAVILVLIRIIRGENPL
jgi:hypothetical protein